MSDVVATASLSLQPPSPFLLKEWWVFNKFSFFIKENIVEITVIPNDSSNLQFYYMSRVKFRLTFLQNTNFPLTLNNFFPWSLLYLWQPCHTPCPILTYYYPILAIFTPKHIQNMLHKWIICLALSAACIEVCQLFKICDFYFRPRPYYTGVNWKRRFHSENASNAFRPHNNGWIWIRNIGFVFKLTSGREMSYMDLLA